MAFGALGGMEGCATSPGTYPPTPFCFHIARVALLGGHPSFVICEFSILVQGQCLDPFPLLVCLLLPPVGDCIGHQQGTEGEVFHTAVAVWPRSQGHPSPIVLEPGTAWPSRLVLWVLLHHLDMGICHSMILVPLSQPMSRRLTARSAGTPDNLRSAAVPLPTSELGAEPCRRCYLQSMKKVSKACQWCLLSLLALLLCVRVDSGHYRAHPPDVVHSDQLPLRVHLHYDTLASSAFRPLCWIVAPHRRAVANTTPARFLKRHHGAIIPDNQPADSVQGPSYCRDIRLPMNASRYSRPNASFSRTCPFNHTLALSPCAAHRFRYKAQLKLP